MTKRTLLSLAVLLVLALPVLQSSMTRSVRFPSPYAAIADTSSDASGGHSTGTTARFAPPQRDNKQYRANQSRGTLPAFGIIAALLSAIRLL